MSEFFPLVVCPGSVLTVGEASTTLDEPAYIQGFANVWNPEAVKAVLNQKANQLGAGDHFVLGCGEVWFERAAISALQSRP